MIDELLPPQMLIDAGEAAVRAACAAGADAAQADCDAGASVSVGVRDGRLEDTGRTEAQGLALTVYVGQRSASISSADLDAAKVAELAQRAVAMARLAPDDPYAGLAPEDRLWRGEDADLDLVDASLPSDAERLRDLALTAEGSALAVEGVAMSEGAGAAVNAGIHAIVTSHGFARAASATGAMISASVLAGPAEAMQRDSDYTTARHFADLETAEAIGLSAGERAVARVAPVRVKSGAMPVVFAPRVASSIVGHIVALMSGPRIARKRSLFRGREGETLIAREFTLRDDPRLLRGLRSRNWDGEGVASTPSMLVDAGTLGGWLCDSASARQLGLAPTGHGSGGGVSASNLIVAPGPRGFDALIGDIGEGIYVTELLGQGVDLVSGDYSRAVSGRRIVGGALAEAFDGATIAGNLLDMFASLSFADDVDRRRSVHVPSMRCDALVVAGD